MSKRCELQKEYYQAKGNYKGNGKYSDDYVSWLEEQILALRIHDGIKLVCNRVNNFENNRCINCGAKAGHKCELQTVLFGNT